MKTINPDYIAKSDNTRIEQPRILNNFEDFKERLRLENERKNNKTGERLKQLVPNYITSSEQQYFNEKEDKEKNKYVIPYIPEKEITLTSGRYNTGKISTNLLDSIYDAAKRTNTDIWTALAIAGRETGLGIARRNPDKSITNSDLVSNWQQFKTIHLTNNQIDKFYEIQDKIKNGTNTPEELELYKQYTNKLRKQYDSIRSITENPLDNMYNFYKVNNPNPGDPEYKTVKIPREIELLKSDPAIQKWYSTKTYKNGGFIDYEVIEEPEYKISDFDPYNYIFPHLNDTSPAFSSSENIINSEKEESPESTSVTIPTIVPFDSKVGLMNEFVELAKSENIPFRITSGFRLNAKTSNGLPSWHSRGLALDIVPKQGVSWKAFKESFKNATKTREWLNKNGFGILEETTPEILAKTGGTGPHWHIGKDRIAVSNFASMFKNGGIIKAQWGSPIVKTYTVSPKDNLTKISNNLEIPLDSLLAYNNISIKDANRINVGDKLLYRKDPNFIDNFIRFLFNEDYSAKNEEIENNIKQWEISSPMTNPVDIAVKFISGNDKHSGWEGFKSKKYWDNVGKKWTIGFGITDPKILAKYKSGISKEDAIKELRNYIDTVVMPDLQRNKWWNDLNPNVQAALIDAHYNLGGTKFNKSTKLINHLNAGNDLSYIIQEMDWNKNSNNGLADRSGARRALAAGQYDWNNIPYSNNYVKWEYKK